MYLICLYCYIHAWRAYRYHTHTYLMCLYCYMPDVLIGTTHIRTWCAYADTSLTTASPVHSNWRGEGYMSIFANKTLPWSIMMHKWNTSQRHANMIHRIRQLSHNLLRESFFEVGRRNLSLSFGGWQSLDKRWYCFRARWVTVHGNPAKENCIRDTDTISTNMHMDTTYPTVHVPADSPKHILKHWYLIPPMSNSLITHNSFH